MPHGIPRRGRAARTGHLQLVRPNTEGRVGEAAARIALAAGRLAAIGREIAAQAGELRALTAEFRWEGRG